MSSYLLLISICEFILMNIPLATEKSKKVNFKQLKKIATEIRIDVIEMIARAGSGHPAGALGMTDVFTALYFNLVNHKPKSPTWADRDYVLLSNGHICPVLYATLAKSGYFSANILKTLRRINSPLQGHPLLNSAPGIEISSGPLGQGLSQACGLAIALKSDKKKGHIYCLLSDGEQQEGQTWEAYMLAAKYHLSNLTAIIDRNMIQIGGNTEEIMPLENLVKKIEAFGWKTYEMDGHNFKKIIRTVKQAKQDKQPSAIIAHTVPGKGVSFMEGNSSWHGKAPTQEQAKQAISELKRNL